VTGFSGMLYVGALKGSSTLAISFLAYKSNRSKLGLEAVNDAFIDSLTLLLDSPCSLDWDVLEAMDLDPVIGKEGEGTLGAWRVARERVHAESARWWERILRNMAE